MGNPAAGSGTESMVGSTPADRLAADLAAVVRQELQELRVDWAEAARNVGAGGLLLAAAGGCALLAVGSGSATLLRMLQVVLPPRLAAAGLTAGYVTAGAFLAAMGLNRLRAAGGSSERLANALRSQATDALNRAAQAGRDAAQQALKSPAPDTATAGA